jgi:hypothetical protein
MSYVIAAPETMTSAATDLATIGSDLTAAHTAAATQTPHAARCRKCGTRSLWSSDPLARRREAQAIYGEADRVARLDYIEQNRPDIRPKSLLQRLRAEGRAFDK